MAEVLVVAHRLALGRLVLGPEVAAAGLVALERVEAHELAELQEVGHAPGVLERLVELLAAAGHLQVLPELLAQLRNHREAFLQALPVSGHAAALPHDLAERAVELGRGALALDPEQPLVALGHGLLGLLDLGVIRGHGGELLPREVIADGVRDDEVAVGQALHQGRGAETVGSVVGEVGLAQNEEAGDRAHQVVVHPEAAHRVVHRRVDPHRHLVGILVGDALVHLEEIAVLLLDLLPAEPADRLRKVEVDAEPRLAHAAALVADALGGPRGNVARGEVAEARVHALQVIVALGLRNLSRRPLVALGLRHPDPPVVAQRLAHQRELGLVITGDRDAGGVDLREAGIGEGRALLVGAPDRRPVAALGVGREIKDVAVPARRQAHGVREVRLDLARDHVPHDDAASPAVHDDELLHLVAREHLDGAQADLAFERLVGAEQELLAGLAARVEGPRDLRAAEGPVVEEPAVLAGEGHALRDALVDDVRRNLGQPVDVGLAGPEISPLTVS